MLEISNLSFDYLDKSLFKGINFSLASGQLLYLRGKNGAGKTTLLKLLAGLLEPTRGNIYFNGTVISKDYFSYQQDLCYIGHRAGINSLLTVKENCFFDLHWQNSSLNLDELCQAFGLAYLEDEPCFHLSAGQKRRVSLLRLFYTKARLWLLDEPLTSLDEEGINLLMKQISMHISKGGSVILSSHQRLPLTIPFDEFNL